MKADAVLLPKPPHRDPDSILLPHSLEAERSILGAALVHVSAADYITGKLSVEDFFRRAHQDIFRAMLAISERKSAPDFVTLKSELERMHKLEDVGGPSYISSLADGVPRSTNIEHYARILHDLAAKRALVGFGQRTLDLVASGGHSASQILIDTDRRLIDLQAGHVEGRMHSLKETARALFSDLEWRVAHKGELTGVETGYPSINELTLGWQAGDLVIIAARPSIGKTTLALNSAVHAAQSRRRDGSPRRIAIFSLEMRRQQLEYRILSQLSGVALSRLLGGHLGAADYDKMPAALQTMHELAIEIDDRAGQTALDIRATCRRLKAEAEGLDMIVIDYVQLMSGTLERRGANRNEEITDISKRLKELADEVTAPVVLLSQLKRLEGRPRLDDLRESGALEQAADVVALLHRKDHRASGATECALAKQRNGPTGTVYLTLDRDTTTFTDGGTPEPEPAKDPDEQKRARRKTFARRFAGARSNSEQQ